MRIRRAYADKDVEESIRAHDVQMYESAPETHASAGAGEIVKSLVFASSAEIDRPRLMFFRSSVAWTGS